MDFWDVLICIALLAAAYLIGAIPFGFLIGKFYGVDVRAVGSGNIGATNVTRTVGKIPGRICFALDFLKGAIPTFAAQLAYPEESWLAFACCALAVLGHIFPVYLRFKGGKGISTAAGAVLALAPLPLLGAAAVWTAGFFIWRYVSLASILAAVSLPIMAWLLGWLEVGPAVSRSIVTLIFLSVLSLVAVLRHIANIKRLLAGTENRFDKSAAKSEEQPNKTETQPEEAEAESSAVTPEDASQKPEA